MKFGLVAMFVALALPAGAASARQPRAAPESSALTLSAFHGLVRQPRAEFVQRWQGLRDADLERLGIREQAGADTDVVERERVRLQLLWAQGRVLHPYFHWRESDATAIEPDPELAAIVATLPIEDRRWWSMAEHQGLVGALLHEQARERLRTVDALRQGDNRWLRAGLAAVDSALKDPELRLQHATRLIAAHVEENGAKGIEAILAQWHERSPDPAAREKVAALVAADLERRQGHVIAEYRREGDVPLEVHILEPPTAAAGPRPAMLWLHGGSWSQGTWWHSPILTAALRDRGVVVVAVELRTAERFDTGPLEQVADASAAYHWLRAHAAEHRIDPDRIGVAGFSSGGTLALILATRGFDPESGAEREGATRARPAAVIVMGAAADPLSARSDGWFRQRLRQSGVVPRDWSPAAAVALGLPRLLAVHATADEYCEYEDMREFVERYRAAGHDAELTTIEGARHFFGFFHKPGQEQTRAAVAAALRRWGW